MRKILLIDDEASIRKIIKMNLEPQGFQVIEADTAASGIDAIKTERPHLIILDLALPDLSGASVLENIRSWSKVPIIVLSVNDEVATKVSLLEAGADDYMTKPFSIPELVARVKASLRHHPEEGAASPVFESGNLKIDLIARKVYRENQEVHLTVTEFNFLRLLVRHFGRVVSQEVILKEIWGPNAIENFHYVRIYVGALRKKIELDPSNPKHILTEPGVGYRIL